jgi:hypothetical protein
MSALTMQELTDVEIDAVSGGDHWAGTPAGRAPAGASPIRPDADRSLDRVVWFGLIGAIFARLAF